MPHRLETIAVHAGQEQADSATNARAVPIYQTASYVFDDSLHAADLFALKRPGNIYTRIMNPTQSVFEERMAALEGGVGALATASGSAAVSYSILNLCNAGDNIVASKNLYGGTFALLAHTLPQFGVTVRFVDPAHPEQIVENADENTRAVFAESLANPSLHVLDIPKWADTAHQLGLPLIIDNTATTPMLCRPFEHGADVVVHSATKYINGHGTSIGGVIVDSGKFDWKANADRFPCLTAPDPAYHGVVWTEAAAEASYIIRARTVLLRNMGASIAPMNSWLFLQGLETLHLRMERHCENAAKVAAFLDQHPEVSWVNYPGLESSPEKAKADALFAPGCYGGLVSFGLQGGREHGSKFVEALQLFSHLANIGDAKSLAIHNASTTHSQLTEDELVGAGVPPEMVRLSVGIEAADDLIEDLDSALKAVHN